VVGGKRRSGSSSRRKILAKSGTVYPSVCQNVDFGVRYPQSPFVRVVESIRFYQLRFQCFDTSSIPIEKERPQIKGEMLLLLYCLAMDCIF
jgi:hypothetical protein